MADGLDAESPAAPGDGSRASRIGPPTRLGRLSVRLRLLLFLLVIGLPMAAAAGYVAHGMRQNELDEVRGAIGRQSADLAARQRASLFGLRQIMIVLAMELARGSIAQAGACSSALADRLRETDTGLVGFAVLGPGGGAVCDPAGIAAPAGVAKTAGAAPIPSPEFNVYLTPEPKGGGDRLLIARLPIVQGDLQGGLLIAALGPEATAGALSPSKPPIEGATWLVDRRAGSAIRIDGDPALRPHPLGAAMNALGAGRARKGRAGDNRRIFYAVSPAGDDLAMLVAVDAGPLVRRANLDFAARLALIVLWLSLGMLVVKLGVRYAILQPLRHLTQAIKAYRGVQAPFVPPARTASMPIELRELTRRFLEVAEANVEREENLARLVGQRDLLVREIHHRVKNNLQIVTSLLSLQAQRIRHPAARHALLAARERVSALSLLHRHLYLQQDVEGIDFRSFLLELTEQLKSVLEGSERQKIDIEVVAPTIQLSSDQVVPLGLVVTEVITNAFKHGFADGRSGVIQIALRILEGGVAELTIRDNGEHRVPVIDEESGGGLGRILIAGFVQQLDGKVETAGTDGPYEMRLTFPLRATSAAA